LAVTVSKKYYYLKKPDAKVSGFFVFIKMGLAVVASNVKSAMFFPESKTLGNA
jgi:hypothetical protein